MTSPQEWGSRGLRLTPPWAPPDARPMTATEQHVRARCPDLCGVRDDPNTSLLFAQGGLSNTMTRSRASVLSASTYDLSGAGFGRPAMRRSASSLTGWRPGFSDFQDFAYSDARRVRHRADTLDPSLPPCTLLLPCCAAAVLRCCHAARWLSPSPPICNPRRGPQSASNLRPSTARSDYELRPWGAGFLQTRRGGEQTLDVTFGGPRLTYEMRPHAE